MNLGSVHGSVHVSVHGFVHGFVHVLVYGTWFMVSLIMFFLNMVDYPFFPFKVHLDFGHHCNTQWYLRLLYEPCNPTQTTKTP